ncbi:MAG: TPM domain-containing protein [Candidatus Methylomirabilales bacterium]
MGQGARRFVGRLDHERIVAAIRRAEAGSTGQIRVHVSKRRVPHVQRAAEASFQKLGMTATDHRNGVLIYVAPRKRTFAIIGDLGIHERCGPAFWSEVAGAMEVNFREERFTEGIVQGISQAGAALARHFPRRPGAGPGTTRQAGVAGLPDEVIED